MNLRKILAPLLAVASLSAHAFDWPQFLGPNRNGVSAETNLVARCLAKAEL